MKRKDIALVILAHNEEAVIGSTVSGLMDQIGERADVHVVADRCIDRTADNARDAGAILHVRLGNKIEGKGRALKWWLNLTKQYAQPEQLIIVLDADSSVAENFLDRVEARFQQGAVALQVRIEPILNSSQPESLFAALSDIVEHRVHENIKSKLGISVRLRGTGMAFRRSLLVRFVDRLHTVVEDAELTVLFGAAGVPIDYETSTCVFDGKPIGSDDAIRQRARWLRGQYQLLKAYHNEFLRLLTLGVSGWSILGSTLLRPRSFFIPFKMVLVVFGVLLGLSGDAGRILGLIIAVLASCSLMFEFGAFVYSLRFLETLGASNRIIMAIPRFIFMWFRSLAMAILSRETWLRSRPVSFSTTFHETRPTR